MTPQEIENFKKDLIDAVSKSAAAQIETSVNGKINRLTTIVTDHIASDTTYKKDMNEWRIEITPVIRVGRRVIDWGEVSAWIIATLAGLAGILALIVEACKRGR
jgi:serine phosphatase RsbU (regulator of sigma subunit)